MINIALLGFGTVGSGVYDVITKENDKITRIIGDKVNIKYILDLRDFPDHPIGDRVVHDFNIILNDPDVSVVAEMMGGSHPAYDFSLAALKSGKHVVTSNKEVVAKFGCELLQVAKDNKVKYYFEASVGGGIPLIRPINDCLGHDSIISVEGILNGTTNYILTEMSRGKDYNEALKQAQSLGYAEANPDADVLGIDARRKICILTYLCFGVWLKEEEIPTQGITGITTDDIKQAEAEGCRIKLTGRGEIRDGKPYASVEPRKIPMDHPLYNINGVYNGITLDCECTGRVMFFGPGAGKLPTASAITADIVNIYKK